MSATEHTLDADECLEYDPDNPSACKGAVEYRWPGSGEKSWPRCEGHGEQRIKRAEGSLERYADSDLVPAWFDPTLAGERWDDDY